jgi:hypothetical protein
MKLLSLSKNMQDEGRADYPFLTQMIFLLALVASVAFPVVLTIA